MIQIPGRSYDHALGTIPAAIEGVDGVATDCLNRLHRAKDGTTERRIPVDGCRKLIVHHVAGIIVMHGDLFEDHSTFCFNVLGAYQRIDHDIAHDIDRKR